MTDAPRLSARELRDIVTDPAELAKGARFFDEGGLAHLARFEARLYADARGAAAAPYKVQITFDARGGAQGRCTCFAARTRPFCKHAAALLVAWSRSPEAFAVADEAPAGARGEGPRRREVRRGKTEASEIMRAGVQQVSTLVRELAVAGVASLGADRPSQVQALAEGLRDQRLRRLSARTLDLARLLEHAAARDGAFDTEEYAEGVADLLLTARKVEKHLDGEPIDPRHVEELIGKTWTKKDRTPIEGLDLVEYSFATRVTADDFVIRESRLVDLRTGGHYSEKQIVPGFLARRTPPKKSHAGRVLEGASGSAYPTFAPIRLDLPSLGKVRPITEDDLATLRDRALPSVAGALAALQEHRRDVFAPDRLPLAVRVDTVLAEGARMRIVDATDAAIFLPEGASIEERLAASLRGVRLHALLGDLALDGALPTLVPLAALIEGGEGLELRPLASIDAEAMLGSRKRRMASRDAAGGVSRGWAEAAREAGLSAAAIALGEVRAEMADALAAGLVALGARRIDPLAARLRDLGLSKQAELLAQLPARSDPAERLDDLVKLHQVLGIALTRLAGVTRVERASLVTVPTYESVRVRAIDETLAPREIAARTARGELNRFQAAVLYARHYERIDPEELARTIYPTWADGSASPFVARAFAGHPEAATESARRALGLSGDAQDERGAGRRRPIARVASITAIRVLEANAEHEGAMRVLAETARSHPSSVIRSYAQQTVRAIDRRRSGGIAARDAARELEAERLCERLVGSPDRAQREEAARALASGAYLSAIPYLRASFASDASREVRRAAALALGTIGDVEMVDVFVRMLEQRDVDPEGARTAAHALGSLGDVRGIDALLDAWAAGWSPAIVAEAIAQIGPATIEPLVARIEARPELTKRKAATSVLAALPARDLEDVLLARLDALATSEDFVPRAATLVALAAVHPSVVASIGARIRALHPDLGAEGATREEKALARKCAPLDRGPSS